MLNPYQELINCQKSFEYFLKYVNNHNQYASNQQLTLHKCQKELIDLYENNQFVMAIKIRQAGILTISVLYALHKCLFENNVNCFIASKTEKEAAHVAKIVDIAFNNFPDWLKLLKKNTKTNKEFVTTNSKLTFGSIETVRGKTVSLLMLDEPAFFNNMEKHWNELAPIWKTAKVFAISTTNGVGNWFHDAWENPNQFVKYLPNYKDVPYYQIEDNIKQTRKALGEKSWLQEVEGCFIGELPDYCEDFINLTDDELLSTANLILNNFNEEKAIIYEIMKRLSKK